MLCKGKVLICNMQCSAVQYAVSRLSSAERFDTFLTLSTGRKEKDIDGRKRSTGLLYVVQFYVVQREPVQVQCRGLKFCTLHCTTQHCTTTAITAYSATGKSYMMGGSPWFYTNLPGYGKSWAWRGDSLWYDRWQQVLDILPEFAEIVTWNDFGESHYIGPIVESGIPQDPDTDARPYVDGMDHTAWLETLEWQIVAYKHAFDPIAYPAPSVKEDKIIYWYRLWPASAGLTSATGNNCPSPTNKFPYHECAPIGEVMEDGIFAIALLTAPGSVSIAIGGGAVQTLEGLQAGINFLSRPFGGEVGVVSVSSSSGVKGSGKEILAQPVGRETNFNAWVGCAGAYGS